MSNEILSHIRCPYCGGSFIEYRKQGFNYKAGFWWMFFLGWIIGALGGWLSHKKTECYCQSCNGKFIIDL